MFFVELLSSTLLTHRVFQLTDMREHHIFIAPWKCIFLYFHHSGSTTARHSRFVAMTGTLVKKIIPNVIDLCCCLKTVCLNSLLNFYCLNIFLSVRSPSLCPILLNSLYSCRVLNYNKIDWDAHCLSTRGSHSLYGAHKIRMFMGAV